MAMPAASYTLQDSELHLHSLSSEELMRLSVIRILQDARGEKYLGLSNLSPHQWQRLTRWLDTSGLALYLFDRLQSTGREAVLPPPTYARLLRNLEDNIRRTQSLIDESIAIQWEFQERRVRYAVLKGLSLWPSSVSKLELRSQLDLDFLVAEDSAALAQEILMHRGYILHGVSGRSWEFRCNEKPGATLKDIYKDRQSWAVELHVEAAESNDCQLDRIDWRTLFGLDMPVLSDIDLFLGQGLHVYKHTCASFMRAAHLWEFRQNIEYRRDDLTFWNDLMKVVSRSQSTAIRFGIALLLVNKVMNESAPGSLTTWAFDSLPRTGQLWVEQYGHRAALASFPGSKRYVLLQNALERVGVAPVRESFKSILPTRLPPPVIHALPNETITTRIARYWIQLKFIAHRVRFHFTAGLDLWFESLRWRKLLRADLE